MLKNKKKKAFTIVELVIVIAVIAVLAAVLIPTFASLIEKANLSSDIQAVRQMNMVVAAESIEEPPADFEALVGILRDANYDVDEGLFPVSKHLHFLWHKDQNEIFLAKIIDDEQVATVVFPEEHVVLTFTDYNHYIALLGATVFDLAYPLTGGVCPVPVTEVTLDKTSVELEVGKMATLTATVTPSNATYKSVTWSSDNENVATVNENGVVTAKAVGGATITATAGGKSATCAVTVSEGGTDNEGGSNAGIPVTGVTITPDLVELDAGESCQLTATVSPENATNKNVKWTSGNTDVATVDQNGKVTAVSEGDAIITVTTEDGSKSYDCWLFVEPAEVSVTNVTITPDVVELVAGGSCQLTANITPENATNKNVVWSSNDSSIATVDQNGKVTAVSEGDAIITVTTEDGSKSYDCWLFVEPAQISDAADLEEALRNGWQCVLTEPVTLVSDSDIGVRENMTLDLNGQILTLQDTYNCGINVFGNLTIRNGSIIIKYSTQLDVVPNNDGRGYAGILTLENVTVTQTGGNSGGLCNKGTTYISNCTFIDNNPNGDTLITNGHTDGYEGTMVITNSTIGGTKEYSSTYFVYHCGTITIDGTKVAG